MKKSVATARVPSLHNNTGRMPKQFEQLATARTREKPSGTSSISKRLPDEPAKRQGRCCVPIAFQDCSSSYCQSVSDVRYQRQVCCRLRAASALRPGSSGEGCSVAHLASGHFNVGLQAWLPLAHFGLFFHRAAVELWSRCAKRLHPDIVRSSRGIAANRNKSGTLRQGFFAKA